MASASTARIDLCQGPLFRQMVVFTLPLILSGLLQLCFNAADMIVVGRFASAESLAAVGSTGPLCNLIVTVFMGLSIGTNVVVAHFTGAKDPKAASRAVHTSIAVALWSGLGLVGLARFAVEPLLVWMKAPPEVFHLALVYSLVFCLGIPFNLLFNFGASILRAVGDTRRPTRYLIYAGILNVILNLLLVIVVRWDVMGVAIATVVSQALSAALVLRDLVREPTFEATSDTAGIGLRWRLLRIDWPLFGRIARIGLPAGLQSSFFSVSNILILSAVASLGAAALAGNAAAGSLEGFAYVTGFAFQQAAISFVGQNYGGRQMPRVRRSILYAVLSEATAASVVAWTILIAGRSLLVFYTDQANVIDFGMVRLRYMMPMYFVCPLMEVLAGSLRGMGRSIQPAVTTFLGACVLRVLWVTFLFPLHRTFGFIMLSYPISWTLVCIVHAFFLVRMLRKNS